MSNRVILKGYERRRGLRPWSRAMLGVSLFFIAAMYGIMVTILPPQLLIIPAVPILLMIALSLWLLPDTEVTHDRFIASAMIIYVGMNILWPSFVAFNLPGLPWISPTRIVLFAALATFIYNYSTSAGLRADVAEALRGDAGIARWFWIFWATTTLSLAFSSMLGFSISRYANNQVYWTALFAISAWLAMTPGFVARFARIMAWSIIVVALVALWEYRVKSAFWVPWLPSFLKADEEIVGRMLEVSTRAYTNVYRVRGTFSVDLYFAEYMAIAFPFVLHALAIAKRASHRILLGLGCIAVMAAMIFTDSRSAALAMLLTPLLYCFMLAYRVRRKDKQSLAANSVVYAYPMMAIGLAVVVLSWHRLRVMVIGGGQHAASSDARRTQWLMGLPKIESYPFGHGVSTSGSVLGFFNPGQDSPTVDSGFLSILLDYGILGLVAFLLLFFATIWRSFTGYLAARTPDTEALGPITVALTNYIIIKAVSSTEINLPIVIIMMGSVMGLLAYQAAGRRTQPAPVAPMARRVTAF